MVWPQHSWMIGPEGDLHDPGCYACLQRRPLYCCAVAPEWTSRARPAQHTTPPFSPILKPNPPQNNQPHTSLRGGTDATPSSAALLARFAAVPRPGLALPSPSCPRYRGDPRLNLKVGGNRMGASCQPAKAAPLRMACSSWSLASRDSSSPGGGVEKRMASECRRRTELC